MNPTIPRFSRALADLEIRVRRIRASASVRRVRVARLAVFGAALAAIEERRRGGGRPLTLVEVGVAESDLSRLRASLADLQGEFAVLVRDPPRLIVSEDRELSPGTARVIVVDDSARTIRFNERTGHQVSGRVGVGALASLRSATTAFAIITDAVSIGRSKTVDIPLTSESVSARHATISRVGNRWGVIDVSRNGTWVDGVRIAPEVSHPLRDGAAVRFADECFTFRSTT